MRQTLLPRMVTAASDTAAPFSTMRIARVSPSASVTDAKRTDDVPARSRKRELEIAALARERAPHRFSRFVGSHDDYAARGSRAVGEKHLAAEALGGEGTCESADR